MENLIQKKSLSGKIKQTMIETKYSMTHEFQNTKDMQKLSKFPEILRKPGVLRKKYKSDFLKSYLTNQF